MPAADVRAALRCGRLACPCRLPDALVHCPAHQGVPPSLRFHQDDGGLHVRCANGCPPDAISAALIRRGLAPATDAPVPEVSGLSIQRLSDAAPQRISWLWPSYIPLGKVTLLLGAAGAGKSWIALDIAARITSGAPAPGASHPMPRGPVLVLPGMEDHADTLLPRLDAQGANPSQVFVMDSVRCADGAKRPLRLPQDVAQVEEAADAIGARLIIVDSAYAYSSATTIALRHMTAALAIAASRTGAALLLVGHLRAASYEAALQRARRLPYPAPSVLVAAPAPIPARQEQIEEDADEKDSRLGQADARGMLFPAKTALARIPPAIPFTINHRGFLTWGQPGERHEAAGPAAVPDDDREQVFRAVGFLNSYLGNGPRPAREVKEAARLGGIGNFALYRARQRANVKAVRVNEGGSRGSGAWYWHLLYRGPGWDTPAEERKRKFDEQFLKRYPPGSQAVAPSFKNSSPQALERLESPEEGHEATLQELPATARQTPRATYLPVWFGPPRQGRDGSSWP